MTTLHEKMLPMILDEYVLVMKELFGWDRNATIQWIDHLNDQEGRRMWLHHDAPMKELSCWMLGSSQVRTRPAEPYGGMPCVWQLIDALEAGLSGTKPWHDVRRTIEDIEREFGFEFIPLIRDN